jgi:hypothetical protein
MLAIAIIMGGAAELFEANAAARTTAVRSSTLQ